MRLFTRVIIAIVVIWVGITFLFQVVSYPLGALPTSLLCGLLFVWGLYFVSKKKDKTVDYSWLDRILPWEWFNPKKKQEVKVPSKTKKVEVEEEEKEGFFEYMFYICIWGGI